MRAVPISCHTHWWHYAVHKTPKREGRPNSGVGSSLFYSIYTYGYIHVMKFINRERYQVGPCYEPNSAPSAVSKRFLTVDIERSAVYVCRASNTRIYNKIQTLL